MRITVSADECDALVSRLTEWAESINERAAQGLKTGLMAVERDAKLAAPVNTGELRNSIRTQVDEYASYVIGRVVAAKEYAVYVEMGTGEVGRASGGNGSGRAVSYRSGAWFVPMGDGGFITRGQPARPFLYPAFKANQRRITAAIRNALRGR